MRRCESRLPNTGRCTKRQGALCYPGLATFSSCSWMSFTAHRGRSPAPHNLLASFWRRANTKRVSSSSKSCSDINSQKRDLSVAMFYATFRYHLHLQVCKSACQSTIHGHIRVVLQTRKRSPQNGSVLREFFYERFFFLMSERGPAKS